MSLFGQTLLLYLLTGGTVAVAVYLRTEATSRLERLFTVATAVVFWPLYLPLLLTRATDGRRLGSAVSTEHPADDMAAAIAEAEAELESGLAGLEGWADEALARQEKRLRDLPAVWSLQAERVRAMDQLLALPDGAPAPCNDAITTPEIAGEVRTPGVSERLRHSLEVRRQNRERLRRVRQGAYEDLMGSLALVRELVSVLHLARFTGAPPARAEELLAQVAASADGLAEVTWAEEPSAGAAGNT
jgi:hypothetical protein